MVDLARTPAANEPVERRARRGQRRALIKVGYSCNDHCVFCHTDDYRQSGDADTASLLAKVDRARSQGFDMVVFSGGEATMRPDLLELTRHVARRGMLLGFITNGRMMSYEQLVGKLLRHHLRYVHLSIHGTERVHNKCTGDRSFKQSFQGLTNLAGRGLDLTVNCVVVEQNRRSLRDLIDLLLPYPDVMLKFSCCEPKGAALRHEEAVVPPLADAAASVVDALRYARERIGDGPGPRFAIENFPLCLMHEFRDLDDDLMANRLLVMSEVWDDGLVDIDDFNKVKPPPCAGCALYASCPGVFVETARLLGWEGLRPVPHDAPRPGAVPSVRGVPLLVPRDPSLPEGWRPPEEARIGIVDRYPDAALLTLLAPGCELACTFCEVPKQEHRWSTLHGVRASMRALRTRCTAVAIGGGEPTSVAWLPELLAYGRDLGYRTLQVQTHAAIDDDLAARLVDAGLTAVDVPLYGATPAAHQAVTGARGSLRRTLAGIEALRARGVRLVVHGTLSAETLPGLPAWLAFVGSLAPDAAYLEPLAEVGVPGWSTVAPSFAALREALLPPLADPPPFPLLIAGIPECVAPELSPWLPAAHPPVTSPDFLVVPYAEQVASWTGGTSRGYAAACATCAARARCPGVSREALDDPRRAAALVPRANA